MSGRPCTICHHPQRTEIDLALAGERSSPREIADRFKVSRHALNRHKNGRHVLRALDTEQTLASLHALATELTVALVEARQSQDQRIKRGAIRQAQETAAAVLRCTTV